MKDRNVNLAMTLSMSVLLALATAPGLAAGDYDHGEMHKEKEAKHGTMEHKASMKKGGMLEDESWIRLNGEVAETEDTSFDLNYGPGMIEVDLEDWNWGEFANAVEVGDNVTVYGQIDDDFFESSELEATSLFVHDSGSYFARWGDPMLERHVDLWFMGEPTKAGYTSVRGVVLDVNENEFTIDMGENDLTVDTDKMSYDPLDAQGRQDIDTGDYVSVTGTVEREFLEGRELEASSVVTLYTL